MPELLRSTVVNATADDVWKLLRDFNGLSTWHPLMPPSEIEDGRRADVVGCTRVFRMNGEVAARETLLALDDEARSYTYTVIESPYPVRGYRATLAVTPVTDTGESLVTWSARFDCDAAAEPELVAGFDEGVFVPGLQALEERFA